MRQRRVLIAASAAAACAVAGAVAGITGSAAAPSNDQPTSSGTAVGVASDGPRAGLQVAVSGPRPLGAEPGAVRIAGGPPVHSQAVVPNRAGTGFDTITTDSGKFKSLSGRRLTITEGTQKATYGAATLTIPSGATVYRNESKSALSDLRTGDELAVIQGPTGTIVNADDAQHQPKIAIRSVVRAVGKGHLPKLPPPLPQLPPPGVPAP